MLQQRAKHSTFARVDKPRRRLTLNELRDRAYELADTGRYSDWKAVAAAIEAEGSEDAAHRLTADPILTTLLNTRCWQAQRRD